MNGIRTRWRPPPPAGHCIKAIRKNEHGVEEVGYIGYIAEATPVGNTLRIRAAGPEGLLENLPLPFDLPLIERSDDPAGYRYWWRQIMYVFDLDDPRLVPPLPLALQPNDQDCVERFIATSRDLAESGVVSSVGGVTVSIDDVTGQESVIADFPRRDLQSGFATLLRQCQGPSDEARFDIVYGRLRKAAGDATDPLAAKRLRQLDGWRRVVISVRTKSLNQLIRDRLVAEEGWKIWEYQEPATPEAVIRRFNYGDLIHWGKQRDQIAKPVGEEYEAAMQRTEFFGAALGLAHVSIGFGELARALITPRAQLWTP